MVLASAMQDKHDGIQVALGGAKTTIMLKGPRNVEHLVKSIEDPISDRHHPAVIAKVMCIQIE